MVRLQLRGVVVAVVAAGCIAFGELAAAGTVVAVGIMAGALLLWSAVLVVLDWASLGRQVTVQLQGSVPEVSAGSPLTVWVAAVAPDGGAGWAPAGALGGAAARRRGRRLSVEVQDPATVLTLQRGDPTVGLRTVSPRPTPAKRSRGRADAVVVVNGPPVPVWVPPSDRGLLWVGPTRVWIAGPLSLLRLSLASADPVQVVVTPTVAPWPPGQVSPVGAGEPAQRQRHPVPPLLRPSAYRSGDEMVGVAPLRPGESAGRVHWPTTVRTGSVATLRFAAQPPDSPTVRLWLDTRALVHDDTSFAAAVSLAAAIGIDSLQHRHRLQLVAGMVVADIRPGRWGAAELLRLLAMADTDPVLSGETTGALAGAGAGAAAAASVVVTTAAGAATLPAGHGRVAVQLVAGGPDCPDRAPRALDQLQQVGSQS